MKKRIHILLIAILILSLLFSSAAAQGNGAAGSGSKGGNPEPISEQRKNQSELQLRQYGLGDPVFVKTEVIASAISQVKDDETKAVLFKLLETYQMATMGESLTQEQNALQVLRNALAEAGVQVSYGDPALYSYSYGREYGRFLDVQKVEAAIALVNEGETAARLEALLKAYQEALENNNPLLVKEALEALMDGLEAARLEVDEYTGLQLYKATLGLYLDCIAVEAAIVALDHPDSVASLLALLDAYMIAANGGGTLEAQEAFAALRDALEAAGIQI